MNNRILVTGGAGYIGSHACKALHASGWMPVVYDDLSNGNDWAVRWGPLERGDIRDRPRLAQVVEHYRPVAVLHFAGLIEAGRSVVDPLPFYDVNVHGTGVLLDVMRQFAIQHLVFSSSAAVYGTLLRSPADESHPLAPVNPYGRTKLATEQMIADQALAFGINWAGLRYFNAAGADPSGEIGEAHGTETHLIPLVIAAALRTCDAIQIFGTDYDTPDGTCVRDYIHVSDLASAHLKALHRLIANGENLICNLGVGIGSSIRQIIDVVEMVSGRKVPVRIGNRRPGDPPILVADAARARSDLDWVPLRSDLTTLVSDAWHWHTLMGTGDRARR